MNKEDDFSTSTVAILGLGLMGGSLALALRGRCKRLIGIDRDRKTVDSALVHGAVDAVSTDSRALLPQADIIIPALPVRAIIDFIRQLPQIHPGPAVVMDIGSTKVEILDAMAKLPKNFDPIGGHPMCGKETSGFENADPEMYQGAPFALTPLGRTSARAKTIAESVVRAVGAAPIWLDPKTHDTWVASTSHLPYLLAVALARSTLPEAAPLVGPGFRDVARSAGCDREMMVDILTTNKEQVLKMLQRFRGKLDEIEAVIRTEDRDALKDLLDRASDQRDFLVRNRVNNESND